MDASKIEKLLLLPTEDLISLASKVRRKGVGKRLETCGIINAKSGSCSEDCKFCAQSAHHSADILEYPLKGTREIVSEAFRAKKNGAKRFGIVTSGNLLTKEEVSLVARAVKEIKETVGILPCASLGKLAKEDFILLKNAGLTRYHHNIETSERFYPFIVSTHDYKERISTVKNAKEAGLEVCSGGILGMGETWQDRVSMALLLKELRVDSVPLNFLVPIKGTPMEGAEKISALEAVRVIALFRIMLEEADIKIAAGRETVLKDFQGMMYSAGANGMMVGGYLTVAGRSPEEDKALIKEVEKLWSEE